MPKGLGFSGEGLKDFGLRVWGGGGGDILVEALEPTCEFQGLGFRV